MQAPVNEKKAFLFVLVTLGVGFLLVLYPFLIPLLLAAIITILLHPIYNYFLKKFHGQRYLSSLLVTFLIFLVIALPIAFIIGILVDQAMGLVYSTDIKSVFSTVTTKSFFQLYFQPILSELEQGFNIHIDLADLLTKLGKEFAFYTYSFSPQVLGRTASFIFDFFIMFLSIFFFFVEGDNIRSIIFELSPLQDKYNNNLAKEFKNMIYATVYGYLLTALFQAVVATIGYSIVHMPAPLVFGALTFFMSLVPIIGSAAVWVPISIWLFIRGDTGLGIFMLVYGLVVISGMDTFIKPMMIREKAKIHILLIFFSLLGGINLFGPIGILFGPVLTAMFLACIRIYRADFLKMNTHKS